MDSEIIGRMISNLKILLYFILGNKLSEYGALLEPVASVKIAPQKSRNIVPKEGVGIT